MTGAEDILSLEVQGVLEKWSRHIKRYQRRFFRCQRDFISYFHYKGHPPAKNAVPAFILDLKDVVRFEKLPKTLSFELYNAKDERVLLCKGSTFGEYKLWSDVLESKLGYLRERGEAAEEEMETHFETSNFTMLALMSADEVDELAQTTLDELLLPAAPRPSSSSSSSQGTATTAAAAGWELSGGDEDKEGQRQYLRQEQIDSMAHRLGDALALMEELCQDLLVEVRDAAASKRRLCSHLFGRYYSSLESYLLLRMRPVLGEEVLGVDVLMEQPLGTIMGLFVCRKRVWQFDATLTKAAEGLAGAANARERNMGTAMSVLSEGSSTLESLLVTEATVVASIVSLTLREVKQRWYQETQAMIEWFAPPSASTTLSSSSSVSLDSPRGGRKRGSGKWGRSLTAVVPTLTSSTAKMSSPRQRDREPPPSPHVSTVFGTFGTILAGLRFDKDPEGDDELQAKAHYLRSKAFTSAMLYLTGELQTLPVQQVRDRGDEQVVVALLQDLAQCRERVQVLQAKYLNKGEGDKSAGSDDDFGGEGSSDEVVDVFVAALERFMTDKAAAAIVEHFLRNDATVAKLVGLLFVHSTWVRDEVTPLLVKLFKQFLEDKLAVLPSVVHERFEARVLRSFLVLYLQQFFKAYVGGKHFDAEETMQCMNDENTVREWVDFRGKWTCREARMEQLWVLKAIRVFLLIPLSDGLSIFSDMYVEGTGAHPGVTLHLYDLFRYCLKLRTDVSPSDLTTVLAVVGAFVSATSAARVGSPPPMPSEVKILLELFPRAGHVHVTGEPWSLEGGEVPLPEETMLGITSLVMSNNEKMRATAKKAALFSSPKHRPVVRVPEVEGQGGREKEAEGFKGQAEEHEEKEQGVAGVLVVGKEQEGRQENGKAEEALTASERKGGAEPLVETIGKRAEGEVARPFVRRVIGMPMSPPSSPARVNAPPSPHVNPLSPSQQPSLGAQQPPSLPPPPARAAASPRGGKSSYLRQAFASDSPPSSPRPSSMPAVSGHLNPKDSDGVRAQAAVRPSSSSSTHSTGRAVSPSGSSVSVTNPFEDEDDEEDEDEHEGVGKNIASPKRSAFGGMFGRRREPEPPAQAPPSVFLAPSSPLRSGPPRPVGTSASPGRRRFRNPFADAQEERRAPSPKERVPQVEPALPSQLAGNGPRRFGGGWGGDEVSGVSAGGRSQQAPPSRLAAPPASPLSRNPDPVSIPQQPQQQQQQREGEQDGRRTFGGGMW